MIQATVAVYPLGHPDNAAIELAIEQLRAAAVVAQVRAMNTELAGDEEAVFGALREAFRAAASVGGVVMSVSVSNACPVDLSPRSGGPGRHRPTPARRPGRRRHPPM